MLNKKTACYIPFLFSNSVHVAVPLALIIDCGFAAWLGHGGFIFPGTGDYYHNIHHTHFDCNYGQGYLSRLTKTWSIRFLYEKQGSSGALYQFFLYSLQDILIGGNLVESTINIGFDWLFGTFAAREEDVKLIWKRQKFGLEDNDTAVFSKWL